MLTAVLSVTHFVFWLSCLVILLNAACIVTFGRWSSDRRKLRRSGDVYVVFGGIWLLFALGFYFYSEHLFGVTVFAFIGGLCCINPLLQLHERSLEWEDRF